MRIVTLVQRPDPAWTRAAIDHRRHQRAPRPRPSARKRLAALIKLGGAVPRPLVDKAIDVIREGDEAGALEVLIDVIAALAGNGEAPEKKAPPAAPKKPPTPPAPKLNARQIAICKETGCEPAALLRVLAAPKPERLIQAQRERFRAAGGVR